MSFAASRLPFEWHDAQVLWKTASPWRARLALMSALPPGAAARLGGGVEAASLMNAHSFATAVSAETRSGQTCSHSVRSIGVCDPPGPFARCGTMHSAAHIPMLK